MTPDEARIVAETEERIVAWLRSEADEMRELIAAHPEMAFRMDERLEAALEIEAGDHRKDTANGC